MFSWFRAAAPLETSEKAWTEDAMRRLADWFGIDTLLRAEFVIPDEYGTDFDGSEKHAREIFDDVCRGMQVARGELEFEILEDVQLPGAAGHYDRYTGPPAGREGAAPIPIVRLGRSQLLDLCGLTATIAHEVAHHRLLGGGFHAGDEPDLETTTDLLPVLFGYGLFPANATVRFKATHTGNWEQWSIGKQGYLPSRIFGYALALAAAFRNERRPRWSRALRPDAKEPFDRGERYLAGGDSLFHPNTYKRSAPPANQPELFRRLADGSATFRYDSLLEIGRRLADGSLRLSLVDGERVADLIGHRDVAVAAAAVDALSACGEVTEPVLREVVRALAADRRQVRAAAVRAMGRFGVGHPELISSFRVLLVEGDADIVRAVVAAATSMGPRAVDLAPTLIKLLERANIHADHDLALSAARALSAVIEDPNAAVRSHYEEGDPELRMLALEALREASGDTAAGTEDDADVGEHDE